MFLYQSLKASGPLPTNAVFLFNQGHIGRLGMADIRRMMTGVVFRGAKVCLFRRTVQEGHFSMAFAVKSIENSLRNLTYRILLHWKDIRKTVKGPYQ